MVRRFAALEAEEADKLVGEVYCTALYCTVLYCTVLYCTVLYCRWGRWSTGRATGWGSTWSPQTGWPTPWCRRRRWGGLLQADYQG